MEFRFKSFKYCLIFCNFAHFACVTFNSRRVLREGPIEITGGEGEVNNFWCRHFFKSYLCPWIFFSVAQIFFRQNRLQEFSQTSLPCRNFFWGSHHPPPPLMVRLKENKIDYVNFNPLSKFVSPHFSSSYGEAIISVPGIICGTIWGSFPVLGSFAVQFGDHLRSRDHLRACTDPCLMKTSFFIFNSYLCQLILNFSYYVIQPAKCLAKKCAMMAVYYCENNSDI